MSSKQTARYCFTLNNYTAADEERLQNLECKYICYGREKAGTTGTPHLQGMVIFDRSRRFNAAVSAIGGGAHVETLRDAAASRVYCQKEGDFYERGELTTPGKRTDTKAIKEAVLGGKLVIDILGHDDMNPQTLRYAEGLQKYVTPPTIRRSIRWYWGPSGAGKTSSAVSEAEASGGSLCILTGKLNFLNGYTGQKNVIIDDFRRDNCPLDELLTLLDRYPKTVNIKGSSVPWMAENIWITSPSHPKDVFTSNWDTGQVLRRIIESPGGCVQYFHQPEEETDWTQYAASIDVYQLTKRPPPSAHASDEELIEI